MRTSLRAIALLAAAALLAPPAVGSPVVEPPRPWLVDADGTDQRQLGETYTDSYYASSWSPDGDQVVFPGPGGAIVFDVATGDSREVEGLGQPDWSPVDDDLLLGIALEGEAEGIYTVRLSTGIKTPVVTSLREDRPVWSPDGSQIAFISGPGSGRPGHLYVVDADGSDLHQVSDVDSLYVAPDWSPDGRELAFSSWDYGLYVVGSDGSDERRLDTANDKRSPVDPQWSPDGTEIITSDMWLFAADGSDVIRLRRGGAYPRWSPDGDEIAYSDGSRIRIIAADASFERVVTAGDENEFDHRPVWSPDGATLSFARNRISGYPPPGQVDITIRYDRKAAPDSFRGALSSPDSSCTRNRKVIVKKDRRGPDKVIGSDRTNRRGNWRVVAPNVGGRFYAVVRRKTVERNGNELVCFPTRSVTIRVR